MNASCRLVQQLGLSEKRQSGGKSPKVLLERRELFDDRRNER
jgi:hypothetical protein